MSDIDDLAGEFLLAFGALRRRMRQLPHDQGATLPELAALARIDRFGSQTGSELAKAEQISPQSMGATVGTLEAKGLISRAADPADGRRVVWSITPAGREVLQRKRGVRAGQLARALSALDPAEVEALRTALPAISKLVDKL